MSSHSLATFLPAAGSGSLPAARGGGGGCQERAPLLHFPTRSLVRDGQTSPHKPRLVVSHSACPSLSTSPHANSFVLDPAVTFNIVPDVRFSPRCPSDVRYACAQNLAALLKVHSQCPGNRGRSSGRRTGRSRRGRSRRPDRGHRAEGPGLRPSWGEAWHRTARRRGRCASPSQSHLHPQSERRHTAGW